MKKTSKSSEISILLVLVTALLIYLGITYLAKPLKSEIGQLKTNVNLRDNEIRLTQDRIFSYGAKANRAAALQRGITDELENFHVNANQEDFLEIVRTDLEATDYDFLVTSTSEGVLIKGVAGDAYQYKEAFAEMLADDENMKDSDALNDGDLTEFIRSVIADESNASADAAGRLYKTYTINLKLNGAYSDTKSLLNIISSKDKCQICRNFNIGIPENETMHYPDYPDDPAVDMTIDLIFVDLVNADGITQDDWEPDTLTEYVLPLKFIDESYLAPSTFLEKLFVWNK